MSKQEEISSEILGRLGSKTCHESGFELLNSDTPGCDEELQSLVSLWYDLETLRDVDDRLIEDELKNLKTNIYSGDSVKRRVAKYSIWRRMLNSAALIAIGAILSFLSYNIVERSFRNSMSDQSVVVPLGSRTQVVLPDGTVVDLNAGSTLSYSKNFGRKDRNVHLVGEGFFNVTNDQNKEFSVITRDMIVKAYGTAFNVKSYPEEMKTEATLVEGIIGIEKPGLSSRRNERLLLKPNERLVYIAEGHVEKPNEKEIAETQEVLVPQKSMGQVIVSKGIETELFTSWKDGRLILKSEPLSEMAIKLERRYNVRITIEDEGLRNYRFTGTFETETVEQVLEAIKFASHINYEIKDRDISLLPSSR